MQQIYSSNLNIYLERTTQKIWELTREYIMIKDEFPFDDFLIHVHCYLSIGLFCLFSGIEPQMSLLTNSGFEFKKEEEITLYSAKKFFNQIKNMKEDEAVAFELKVFESVYINHALCKSKKDYAMVPDLTKCYPIFYSYLKELTSIN